MNIQEIPINKIHLPPGRRQLKNLESLSESISKRGFINPITLGTDYSVIAGGGRLEAARMRSEEYGKH